MRRLAVGMILILATVGAGACGSAAPPAATPPAKTPLVTGATPAVPPQAAPIKIGAAKTSSPSLPLYAADQLGLFRQNQVQVEAVPIEDATVRFNALIGKSVDMLLHPPNQAITANASGAHVKLVLGILNVSLLDLMVKPEVQKVQDLRGKTGATLFIGHAIDSVGNRLFERSGLNPERDITWISVGNTAGVVAAMSASRADFTLISAPSNIKLEDLKFKTLLRGSDSLILYPTLSLMTRQDVIDRDPAAVERAIRAIAQAIAVAKADRAKGIDLLADQLGETDRKLVERTYDWLAPGLEADCASVEGLNTIKADMVKSAPDVAKISSASVVDESFVRRIATGGNNPVTIKRCGAQ